MSLSGYELGWLDIIIFKTMDMEVYGGAFCSFPHPLIPSSSLSHLPGQFPSLLR
jgi:hypothetical protein